MGLTGITTGDSIDKNGRKEGTLLGLHVVCPQSMANMIAGMAQHRTRSFVIRGRARIPAWINNGGTMVMVVVMILLYSQRERLRQRLAVHEPMI
jgi:hypothetical protein